MSGSPFIFETAIAREDGEHIRCLIFSSASICDIGVILESVPLHFGAEDSTGLQIGRIEQMKRKFLGSFSVKT